MNDDHGLDKEDIYVHRGDDTPEVMERKLQDLIQGSKAKGLSNEEAKTLNNITDQHKPKFKIKMGSGGPAKVMPIKIELDD